MRLISAALVVGLLLAVVLEAEPVLRHRRGSIDLAALAASQRAQEEERETG